VLTVSYLSATLVISIDVMAVEPKTSVSSIEASHTQSPMLSIKIFFCYNPLRTFATEGRRKMTEREKNETAPVEILVLDFFADHVKKSFLKFTS